MGFFAQDNHFVWAGSFFGELGAGAGEGVKTHGQNSDPLECPGCTQQPRNIRIPLHYKTGKCAQSQRLHAAAGN